MDLPNGIAPWRGGERLGHSDWVALMGQGLEPSGGGAEVERQARARLRVGHFSRYSAARQNERSASESTDLEGQRGLPVHPR